MVGKDNHKRRFSAEMLMRVIKNNVSNMRGGECKSSLLFCTNKSEVNGANIRS